jgi:hypothetical protein
MNKYLMLTAAALLTSAGCAGATEYCYTWTFGTAGGGSYCDGGMIAWDSSTAFHGAVRTWTHLMNNCGNTGNSNGWGMLGKTKGLGDYATLSDNAVLENGGTASYSLPKKIEDGAKYIYWLAAYGSVFEAGTGVLNQVAKCQDSRPASHGRTSTLATVKAMLEARRAHKS